jgi:hypothetical protein
MAVDKRDLNLMLAGLFELRITHLEDDDLCAAIDALALKLGGDPAAMFLEHAPPDTLQPRARRRAP